MRLCGNDHFIRSSQGIDGQHTQGRAAVQQNHIVAVTDAVQIVPQDRLPAHGIYQRDLQARQLDVSGEKVNALRMMNNALVGGLRLIRNDTPQDFSHRILHLVRTLIAQAGGQRTLGIYISQENAFTLTRKTNSQIDRRYGFAYTGSMVHNYYLYEQDGQMSMIPWDYNLAFGTFQSGDASGAVNDPIDTPLSVTGDGSRPMADWILARQEYTQLYHQYFREFLDSAGWAAIIEQAYDLIAPYVERDPTKFCTYQEFEAGVQALTAFCTLRSQSVDGQLSGSIPSTNKGQAADSSNLVDASTLSLAQMGTMEEGRPGAGSAFLGGPGGESSAFPGEPGGESDTFPEGGGVPAMGDGDAIGNRRPAGGAQAQDGFPGSFRHSGGAPGGESAKIDAAALALLGISVLTLLAGILVSFRFRRSGRLRARGTSPG